MAYQQDPTRPTVMTESQTDQYGNPVLHTGGMGTYGAGAGTGVHGGAHQQHHHQHESGVLHRSGSSSSSSSEDDGQGGRRKKGIKEKIKEKIPDVGHKDEQKHTSATATMTPDQGQHHKGMMEKIKEKLPGSH